MELSSCGAPEFQYYLPLWEGLEYNRPGVSTKKFFQAGKAKFRPSVISAEFDIFKAYILFFIATREENNMKGKNRLSLKARNRLYIFSLG